MPETTVLQMTKDAMISVAKLSAAVLGVNTTANGFAVTPTGPASLQVVCAPGEIYSLASIDSLAFSTLPADTTHSIVKQGIMLDALTLNCPAPTTTGQSINYLVQATYQDVDSSPVLLPYYNSANPALPYSGMGNNGLTQNTSRKGSAVVAVKAGVSAATGSQTTPAPDAGYVGLYVVTVAFGQTTITSTSIAQYVSAPLLPSGLLQSIQNGNTSFAVDTGTANAYVCNFTPAITARSEGQILRFKVKTANTSASTFNDGLGAVALVGGAHSALQGGELIANGDAWVEWNTSIGGGSYILLFCTGAAEQVAPATQSQHAMPLGQATGRLLRSTTYSGGTFTWNIGAGTTAIRVRIQAPGGSGAGAPATAAGQVSVGSGGSGGASAEGFYTGGSVPSSATVTVPTGPTGGVGANGTAGSPASFGALISAPGGLGGLIAGPSSPPFFAVAVGSPAVATGGNVLNTTGGPGGATSASSVGNFSGGAGGSSPFGPGGAAPGIGANGVTTSGYGGGGQGSAQNASGAALTGGRAAPAVCIVDEYGSI